MTGSEKQINWANDIKANYQTVITQVIDGIAAQTRSKRPDQVKLLAPLTEMVNEHVAEVCENDSAKFWIDNYLNLA